MSLSRTLKGRHLATASPPIPHGRTTLKALPLAFSRSYATHNSLPRKSVTVTNDDGRIQWGELNAREKVARTTQQSFNFVVVIAGIAMTGTIAWYLYQDVFSSDSKISHFNRVVDRIKKDSKCVELLGDARKIKAYGEPTWNRWARNRPIASRLEVDKMGTEHLYMNFNVEGPLNSGRVSLHMSKRPSQQEFEYRYLFVDIKGQERIWLENADAVKRDRPSGRIFGIKFW